MDRLVVELMLCYLIAEVELQRQIQEIELVLTKVDAPTPSLKSLSPLLQIEMAQHHLSFFDSHGHGHVGGAAEATVGDSHQRPPWWATTTTQL